MSEWREGGGCGVRVSEVSRQAGRGSIQEESGGKGGREQGGERERERQGRDDVGRGGVERVEGWKRGAGGDGWREGMG